jgi:hypothetical protein
MELKLIFLLGIIATIYYGNEIHNFNVQTDKLFYEILLNNIKKYKITYPSDILEEKVKFIPCNIY